MKFWGVLLMGMFAVMSLNCGDDDDSAPECRVKTDCPAWENCVAGRCEVIEGYPHSGSSGGGQSATDDDDDQADDDDDSESCELGTVDCRCALGLCGIGLICSSDDICVLAPASDDDDDSAADDDDDNTTDGDDDSPPDGWDAEAGAWYKTVKVCYMGNRSEFFGAVSWALTSGAWAHHWDLPITFSAETGLSCFEAVGINMVDIYGNIFWVDLHRGPGEDGDFMGMNYSPYKAWLSGEEMEKNRFDSFDGVGGAGWMFLFF